MTTKRPLLWTLSVAIALLAPVAGAQPAAPRAEAQESDALTERARQLFEDGVKAAKAGKWDDAHAAFLAAWAIKPHYQIASNLGVTSLRVGKPREAAEYLTLYLREAPATKVQERQLAEASLQEARAQIATVTLRVAPDGAEVTVDGKSVGRAPIADPVFLDPGRHEIGAKLDGYVPEARPVEATAGGTEGVVLELKRAPEPSAARAGAGPDVPPASGGSRDGGRTAVLVGGGIAAGLGVGAGVLFTVLANNKAGEADRLKSSLTAGGQNRCSIRPLPADCTRQSEALDQSARYSNVAFWSFVGAGTVGLGTLIYGFVSGPSEPEARVRVTPMVGANDMGLSVGGAF
ncbi:PEGA domain-containing protein [Sorangium sp. So ce513]|uniref:PEGA domain-containing protein n=1 Tax=Sorangium sp. So ce513 TaxID=3133315 RepID=UPI003F628031